MSCKESPHAGVSTTTISSVAVQAGNSKIVIALVKCGEWVQLQLTESQPNLLEIGSSQDETKKLLRDHELLLAKLKALEDRVWELLQEADRTAEANKAQSQVYDAMAQTLGEAWATLVSMLEKRRELLGLTSEFFESALEFAIKIDQTEAFLQNPHEFESTEALQSLLQLHDRHAKELLERSLVLLNKSQQLTDFIEKFKCDGSDVNAELIQGAQSSCLKIDSLLELLQDRRRQLDKYLQQRRQELAQVLQLCLWDQQENQVTCWFQKTIRDLQEQSLGSSLSDNKELIRKHEDLEVRAKEWNSTVEKLKSQALEILLSKDFTDKEHLQLSNQKLNRLQEEFGRLMVDRKTWLTLANDFFNSANKAFDVLGEVEAYLKLLKSENLSLPVLAARHEELHGEIKDSAAAALQKGWTLISQADSCSSQVMGIQEMMGCIQKHVDRLGEQCTAHKEYALKKQQLAASVEGALRKVEMSIQEIRPVLSNTLAVGSSPSESEKILDKYLELDIQAKETAHTLEAAAEIMAEKNELELDEGALLSFKAKCLEEELSTLGRSISYRSRVLQTYVAFRKSSEEVEEQLQRLKAFYLTKVPPTTEDDAEVKYWSNSAERRWQLFLKKSFVTQDLGLEFLNLVNMAKENEIFNAKDEMRVMRNTMEKQTTGREELSRLRMAWYLKVSGSKPVRQQWETFKEKLKKTTHNVKLLHEVLMPVSALDLGGSLQTMSDLRRRWNAMKPQLQQLYDEVQHIMKEWEVLSGQGAPLKEKADQLKDLIHLHERQRARIRDYEEILYKTIQFHQVKEELMHFIKSKELKLLAQPAELESSEEVQMQLDRSQERRAHVEHLGRLALSLGVDIISSVQQPNCSNISAKSLQQQLEVLELESREWSASAKEYERVLSCILEFCTTREEINELKESFKDIKKKFNNLKFNYSKKNEKSRNLKTLQYQIQQVDMYAEKIQALRKKMENVNNKTSDSFLSYPSNKVNILLEAMEDLQKHVDDFDKVVTDYKVNLDLTEHLQEIIEECNFWYEDAGATVVRVGKYSLECQTKEAVEILHTQFNKFIAPSVPQQEERIQEVTDLARRLYGLEEGQKYAEKTVTRHKEILESISELCGSLVELKEKLEQGDVPKQGDLPKMNPNLEVFHDNCIDLLKEPPRNEQTLFNEERNEGQVRGADTLGMNGTLEHGLPMDLRQSLPDKEGSAQGLTLLEDMLSGEESECISSDDVSLPPLPMSPESPMAPSDMEVGELASSSAPMLRIGGYRTHAGTGALGESQESVLPPPIAFADGCHNKEDTFTTHFERPYPQFKAESSLTSKGSVEMSTKLHINVECPTSMPHEVHARALQQGSQARESSLETQEKVHADSNVTKTQDRLHDPPAASPGLGSQSDTSRRQAGPQGDRKHSSAENSVVSLAGQAPHFSRLLSNVTVTEGSPVTLEVEVTGFPEPTLTWFKKGQQLCADGHLQVLHKDTKHSVFIPKVCEADAGLYVAQAQNSSGTLSSKAILHVTGNHGPPITRINWIVLCAIYVSVSLIYWLLAQ